MLLDWLFNHFSGRLELLMADGFLGLTHRHRHTDTQTHTHTHTWATGWPHMSVMTYSVWALKVESVVGYQDFAFHSSTEWTNVDDVFIWKQMNKKHCLLIWVANLSCGCSYTDLKGSE